MEFGQLFDAAIDAHLQEHLQSIGLTMKHNVKSDFLDYVTQELVTKLT